MEVMGYAELASSTSAQEFDDFSVFEDSGVMIADEPMFGEDMSEDLNDDDDDWDDDSEY